jgi:hypothetical protein
MGKRFAILIGVAAAGVMALGAQTGAAVPALASQTVKIDSEVTLAVEGARCDHGWCSAMAWYGPVKSSRHACKVDRTVKVFETHGSGPGTLVKKDKSNRHGKWRVVQALIARPRPSSGFFYAKVVRQKKGTAGTGFICRADRSKVVDFH